MVHTSSLMVSAICFVAGQMCKNPIRSIHVVIRVALVYLSLLFWTTPVTNFEFSNFFNFLLFIIIHCIPISESVLLVNSFRVLYCELNCWRMGQLSL